MGLSVRYNVGNRFSPMTGTGKRILSLAVNARLLRGSTPHFFVTGTQSLIAASLPDTAVEVAPAEQAHVTVINPVFKMEPDRGPIPSDEEARELFGLFQRTMASPQVQSFISQTVHVQFDRFVFRENDVKLCGISEDLQAMRDGLADILKEADGRFDLAGWMREPHTTIARFGPGISKADYRSLRGMIEKCALDMDDTVNFHINPENLVGVMFTGLFMPWVREFSLADPLSF